MKTIRQHEPLRVPAGWTDQDKALVIQLERILNDIYRLIGNHDGAMVTAVSYDTTNKKLTVTINGQTADVVTVATIKTDLSLSKSDVGLSNVENKSSADIRNELTLQNVVAALGYTPPQSDTKNTTGTTNKKNTKLFLVGAETQATNPQTNSNVDVYIGTDNCLYSGNKKVLTDHQDISGKADKSATVSTVTYDNVSKKITKTIDGNTTDVVAVSDIKSALGSFTWGALAGQ